MNKHITVTAYKQGVQERPISGNGGGVPKRGLPFEPVLKLLYVKSDALLVMCLSVSSSGRCNRASRMLLGSATVASIDNLTEARSFPPRRKIPQATSILRGVNSSRCRRTFPGLQVQDADKEEDAECIHVLGKSPRGKATFYFV